MLQVTTTERNGRIYYKIMGNRNAVIDEQLRLFALFRFWNFRDNQPFVLDSGIWLGEVSHVKES